MNDELDNNEKTENPTLHRIKKEKKYGNIKQCSKELNSLIILFSIFLMIWFFKLNIFFQFKNILINNLMFDQSIVHNFPKIKKIFISSILNISIFFFLFMAIVVLKIIFFSFLFGSIGFTTNFFKKNIQKINILNGIKQIFSFQSIAEFFKIIIKIFIISFFSECYIVYISNKLFILMKYPFNQAFLFGINIIYECYLLLIIVFLPTVFFDIFSKNFHFYKSMKMSPQEIKQEIKEIEGNVVIKNKIRHEMKKMLGKKEIFDTKRADLIIVDNIFYSVVLHIDSISKKNPTLLAKGKDKISFLIIQLAKENNIPILYNSSLAIFFYKNASIGNEIPEKLYNLIYDAILWINKMKRWKRTGGVFPKKPKNIFISN
ncbi:EscU/YscU/HrcU family type III secretion system export apparatus switch protein [Buchnera aphidicola]|uniref:EscU/YscU/HrcU family type III secretion system export apparatus switch protein n=1 Tax=Buchnera aphidicola TaxID=9 RepID=UPI0031B6701B